MHTVLPSSYFSHQSVIGLTQVHTHCRLRRSSFQLSAGAACYWRKLLICRKPIYHWPVDWNSEKERLGKWTFFLVVRSHLAPTKLLSLYCCRENSLRKEFLVRSTSACCRTWAATTSVLIPTSYRTHCLQVFLTVKCKYLSLPCVIGIASKCTQYRCMLREQREPQHQIVHHQYLI